MKSPKGSNSMQFQSNHLQQQPEFYNNEDNINRNQQSQEISDYAGYEVSTDSLVTQHQNKLRPILCLKNIIKVLCILILSLFFYVGYMIFNKSSKQMNIETLTNKIQNSKDLIQPVNDKNDSFLIKNVQNTITNPIIPQIGPQIKKNRPTNSELARNSNQIVKHDNIENAKGDKKSYNIKISEFPKSYINGEDIQQFGISKDIQIGSIYDYLNVTHSSQFKNFKQNWQNQLKFQIYQYQYNLSLQTKQQVLEYTQFKNKNEIESYLNSLNQWNGKQNYGKDLPFYLSSHILWNPKNRKIQQIQLYYLQKNYMLSNYPQELSICLFSTGYNIFSRDRHIYFLNSIQQQNYTNYHIVAVDDCSPDNTATRMYQYLNKTDSKLKNRIKIVRNIIKMGATASTYYWSKKLCQPGDIIVHVDMDDMLLGRQVFKVLNTLYHNKNLWYVYTRYLRQDDTEMMPNAGKSRPMRHDVATYRYKLDWLTSAMRTLRYQVMANVPLQHVIQYHYDETSQQLMPKFYDTDADRFLIYSQLELCGNSRIKYIHDVFYYYNISNNIGGKCNMRHEHIDEYKSRIKTGVKPMKSLQDRQAIFYRQQQVKIPKNITKNLKDRYIKYKNCLNNK